MIYSYSYNFKFLIHLILYELLKLQATVLNTNDLYTIILFQLINDLNLL